MWDSESRGTGDLNLFLKNGYELETFHAMVASTIKTHQKPNKSLSIKIVDIENAADWETILALQVEFAPPEIPKTYYREFCIQLLKDYQTAVAKGKASWFLGSIGDKPVASLAISWDVEERLGLVDRVIVSNSYRRQGIGSTLLHRAAQFAFEKIGLELLSLSVEEGSEAIKMYSELGFEIKETIHSLYKSKGTTDA